ncbi:MAG: tetratricopeptide (TPR) repeat protein [Myxococcota bacterium]
MSDSTTTGLEWILNGGPAGPLSETRIAVENRRLVVSTREWRSEPWAPIATTGSAPAQLVGLGVNTRLRLATTSGPLDIDLGFMGETLREMLAKPRPTQRRPQAAPQHQPKATPEPHNEPPTQFERAWADTTQPGTEPAPDHLHGRSLEAARAVLERKAIEAMQSGRYDLAVEHLTRLANATGVNKRVWLAVAGATAALGRGDAQSAFFTIRDEVDETVTVAGVCSALSGNLLYKQGKMALAVAAFTGAALATASGQQDELKARAETIGDEAGLGESGLEVALIAASIEHYTAVLHLDPENQTAVRVLKEAERWRKRVLGAAAEVAEPVVAQARRAERADQKVTGGKGKAALKYATYALMIALAFRACL